MCRYILFFCRVLCAALEIALTTLAGMGTSAVSSLSYVLTFVFPGLSLGVFTFLVNYTILVGQVLLLRHRSQSIQLLQILVTLLFSVCVDLWTELLTPLMPESYGVRWVMFLLGRLSLGLRVALEVLPNVLVLPCEGFIRTTSQVFGWDFGKTKAGYDLAMVSAAALLSYLSLGAICDLRGETIVYALAMGGISRFLCHRLSFLQYPGQSHPPIPAEADGAHTVVEP